MRKILRMSKHPILNWIVTIDFSLKQEGLSITHPQQFTIKVKGPYTKLIDHIPNEYLLHIKKLQQANPKLTLHHLNSIILSATDERFFPTSIENRESLISELTHFIQKKLPEQKD